jgi:hypothetical protein
VKSIIGQPSCVVVCVILMTASTWSMPTCVPAGASSSVTVPAADAHAVIADPPRRPGETAQAPAVRDLPHRGDVRTAGRAGTKNGGNLRNALR